MRRLWMSIACAALLGACAPTVQSLWWKEGAGTSRADILTDCEVEALSRVPRDTAIATTPVTVTPRIVVPPKTVCETVDGKEVCTTTPGYSHGGQVIGGQTYTYDRNDDLRERVLAQCMAREGFTRVQFPTCTTEDRRLGVTLASSGRLPPAERVLCVSVDPAGWVLR